MQFTILVYVPSLPINKRLNDDYCFSYLASRRDPYVIMLYYSDTRDSFCIPRKAFPCYANNRELTRPMRATIDATNQHSPPNLRQKRRTYYAFISKWIINTNVRCEILFTCKRVPKLQNIPIRQLFAIITWTKTFWHFKHVEPERYRVNNVHSYHPRNEHHYDRIFKSSHRDSPM